MKTDIHNKGFAVRLALKERLGELGNGPLGGHLVTSFVCFSCHKSVMVQFTRRLKGFLVTLIQVYLHLIECNPGRRRRDCRNCFRRGFWRVIWCGDVICSSDVVSDGKTRGNSEYLQLIV